MTITRDTLAEVLSAVKTEAAAHGDVRVDLADIKGSLDTLTTEVRLTMAQQRIELNETKVRVTAVEHLLWRSVGAALVIGAVLGVGGTLVVG